VGDPTELDEALCGNLEPAHVLEELRRSEEAFERRYLPAAFLLVRLTPGDTALATELKRLSVGSSRDVQPSVRVMGYETQLMSSHDLNALTADDPARGLVRLERLRWMLRNDRHFALPLRKRTDDDTFADRISLGRATNRDVVLRHGNVSKFHAWFEVDDQGSLYVADASSTNGSYLNDKRLPPKELVKARSGDHLRFGAVQCLLASAADLWRAMRRG